MTVLFPCIIFHKPSVRVWGGQGYPNKHHEYFKVIFSITREEIELPVKIGDKNLNLTQPTPHLMLRTMMTKARMITMMMKTMMTKMMETMTTKMMAKTVISITTGHTWGNLK